MSRRARLGLDLVLHPFGLRRFLEEVLEKKVLHLDGTRDKFRSVFERAAFDAASVRPGMRLKAAFETSQGEHEELYDVPARDVNALLGAGMTICAGGIDVHDAALTSLIQDVSRQIAWWGHVGVNAYLSPDGAGFGTHFDDHSSFILQIEGRKEWSFSTAPGMRWPPGNVVLSPRGPVTVGASRLPVERPDESRFQTVVLEPGAVLYLPSGTWHRTRAVGSSLALTLRGPHQTPLDLVRDQLVRRLGDREQWRTQLPIVATDRLGRGEPLPELRGLLEDGLADLRREVLSLDATRLLRDWYTRIDSRLVPVALGPDRPRLGRQDRLVLTDRRPMAYFEGPGDRGEPSVFFYWSGREWPLPVEARAILEAIAARRSFRAESLTRCGGARYPWQDIRQLLVFFLRLGVLERSRGRA